MESRKRTSIRGGRGRGVPRLVTRNERTQRGQIPFDEDIRPFNAIPPEKPTCYICTWGQIV